MKLDHEWFVQTWMHLFKMRDRCLHFKTKLKLILWVFSGSDVGSSGGWAEWQSPQGQFETSQLELSLKSHAFEKFVYLHIHSLVWRPAHKYERNIV